MKVILYTLFFTVFSASVSFAQSYQALIAQGDSLFKLKKYDSSLHAFEEAINAATKLNAPVPERDWFKMFMGAGNAAGVGKITDTTLKYWNLAMGGKGERLLDKINSLLEFGMNSVTITTNYYLGRTLRIGGCSSNVTTHLLWINNGDLFVQKFDECGNYPPFKFENSGLLTLKNKKIAEIKLDTIKDVNNHGYHEGVDELVFYTKKGSFSKTVNKLDFTDPATKKPHNSRISPATSLANYKKNIATSLSKLLTEGNMQIKEYEIKLSSPSERFKVGKL